MKCRWVYKIKVTFDVVVEFHKDCLVAKVFSHQEGIDYTDTFSPFMKMNYVRLILSLCWVKYALSNSTLKLSTPEGSL